MVLPKSYVAPHKHDPSELLETLRTSAPTEVYRYSTADLDAVRHECRKRMDDAVAIRGRIKACANGREPTAAQKRDLDGAESARLEYASLIDRVGKAITHQAEATREAIREQDARGEIEWINGDGSGPVVQTRRPAEHDNARRAADAAIAAGNRNGLLSDASADLATRLMENGPANGRSLAARWMAATGSPEYLSAFTKIVADPSKGHMLWDRDEQAAYQRVEAINSELRDMSVGVPGNGGYMVPFHLDPTIMLTNDGVRSPLRSLARVERIIVDRWHGITSAGTTSEWLPELQEAAEQTPTVAQPEIPVHKLSTYVEFSVEVQGDAVNFLQQLQTVMLDAANTTMETAYATGTGTGQPAGLITGLVAAGGSTVVAPTVAESFTSPDVFKVQNSLGPRWQPNASWIANLSIINTLHQFETGNGALKFPEVGGGQLLRRPLSECSTMDGAINPAATESNHVLAYGSWRDAFVIVDRVGATMEIVPHVLGTNRRPIGARGAWLWLRTGSKVVVPEAGRILSIPTTA